METNKVGRKMGAGFAVSLSVGLALLAAGIVLRALDVQFLENDNALIGISFISLTLAAYYGLTAALAKRNPKCYGKQSDERIVALKHRADSIALCMLQWVIVIVSTGYTLAFPTEIFESAGWWIAFAFCVASVVMPAVVLTVLTHRDLKDAGS